MAEVGFVKCATVALRVGQAVLPASRRTCSQPRGQQPQLLAILCLMRDEDWTFHKAEVRLAEHAELRAALGLSMGLTLPRCPVFSAASTHRCGSSS